MRIYMPRAYNDYVVLCCARIKYLIKQLQELIKELTADLRRASFCCFCSLLVVLIQTNTVSFPTVLFTLVPARTGSSENLSSDAHYQALHILLFFQFSQKFITQ